MVLCVVAMRVPMDVVAVRVGVIVDEQLVSVPARLLQEGTPGRQGIAQHAAHARERQQAEDDEHHPDGKLHGQSHPGRDHDTEQDDRAPDREDRERMTDAPAAPIRTEPRSVR